MGEPLTLWKYEGPNDPFCVWTDGNPGPYHVPFRAFPAAEFDALTARLAEAEKARAAARREALEEAARWHDARADAAWAKRHPEASRRAKWHAEAAAAIRALIPGVGGSAGEPVDGATVAATPAAPIAWDLWQHGETGRTVELPVGSPSPGRGYSFIGTMRAPAAPSRERCPACDGPRDRPANVSGDSREWFPCCDAFHDQPAKGEEG